MGLQPPLELEDPIIGTTTKEAVQLLMEDDETNCIVMIGEIGGQLEAEAAHWVKASGNKKPVVGFIAGETAQKDAPWAMLEPLLEAPMILRKPKRYEICGIHVVDSPTDIGKQVAALIG